MAYQHGVRVLENPTSLTAPILGTAAFQVVVGVSRSIWQKIRMIRPIKLNWHTAFPKRVRQSDILKILRIIP